MDTESAAWTGGSHPVGRPRRPPPSLPYKVDTSRPSLRTNWTHVGGRGPRARRPPRRTRRLARQSSVPCPASGEPAGDAGSSGVGGGTTGPPRDRTGENPRAVAGVWRRDPGVVRPGVPGALRSALKACGWRRVSESTPTAPPLRVAPLREMRLPGRCAFHRDAPLRRCARQARPDAPPATAGAGGRGRAARRSQGGRPAPPVHPAPRGEHAAGGAARGRGKRKATVGGTVGRTVGAGGECF